jgi:uncharacterized membrane protein YqiK
MSDEIILLLLGIGALAVFIFGLLVMIAKFYRQVDQGTALIVNTMQDEPIVTFTGKTVYPIIHRAETMDISVKTIELARDGKDGLICKDNIRADIKVTFFVRVNKTKDDVLRVAQAIGCARASSPEVIQELFVAKFSEALKTVGKMMNFESLYAERQGFKDEIIRVIGTDLNGFVLDDCAIDYLEQTPIETLDKDNIMDAEGIRKITELTVIQNVKTNDLRQKERMEMGSQNLASDEAIFRFDKARAEADAKKNAEIAVAQARHENEARRIAEAEHKQTMLIRQKNEEEVLVAQEGKERATLVARQNKEREVAVEKERTEKARVIEQVGREREFELQTIAKQKDVEIKKKEIADVIRGRIAVDKTVAEEEERIKDLRTLSQSNREKQQITIAAEAAAADHLVKQVKAAEASEQVAQVEARKKVLMAEADLESSDKAARAKIRMAEGVQAEAAAEGLAQVKIKEADAAAIEKLGLVEARVLIEKMQAAATGEEKQGLAKVRVQEAEAAAIEKKGIADALVVKEMLNAEATGAEAKGHAAVRVQEATAGAIEKTGAAEASATRLRLTAEADGISAKMSAMKQLDAESRGHEEFRIRLEAQKDIAMAALTVREKVAAQQATILAHALDHAKIQIVGGDGQFFDRFIKAVSLGQSFDTTLEQSSTLQGLLGDYVNGEKDLKELFANGGDKTTTISSLLNRLSSGADEDARAKIAKLAARARDLGIDDLGAP